MERKRALIIAEAGVNHNGSMELARKLIDVAAEAGADYVKFQTFKPEKLTSRSAKQAEYQKKNIGREESQLEMLKKLTLQPEQHAPLIEHCRTKGIRFLSTPFEVESLKFLIEDCGIRLIKIPSGEITNAPFLWEIGKIAAQRDCEVVLSTGMSTLSEVESALGVLAFGLSGSADRPGSDRFQAAFASADGKTALRRKVTVLHCTTEYPAPFETLNLRAMDTLRETFALPVGFSDHSSGISAPIAAVARGATTIEKHFTLDRNLPGPDHKASLEPAELQAMVRGIREVEISLGSPVKAPTEPELKNLAVARKVIVAGRPIAKGEVFSEANLEVKRAGAGISPMRYWEFLGRSASRDYREDEAIQ